MKAKLWSSVWIVLWAGACGVVESRNDAGNTQLYEAAAAGNLKEAQHLVEEGADIDSWNTWDEDTPSLLAFFIREKASLGLRPLHAAAKNQKADVVRYLLEQGADVNGLTRNQQTALWFAATAEPGADATDTASILLEHGALVDLPDVDGVSPLLNAAAHGRTELVRQLTEKGADGNRKAATGETAIHLAAMHGHAATVTALVRGGARVDAPNQLGQPPLQAAAVAGQAKVIEALLRAGADPNGHAPGSSPPILNSAYRGQTDVVRLLLEFGARPELDENGGSALLHAAKNNHPEIIPSLIHCGSDPERPDPDSGRTPLQIAVLEGHAEAALALLEAGADPDSAGSSTSPPLARAAREGRLEIVRSLVEYGAELNALDGGWTPLRLAEIGKHENVVAYLREQGASVE